MSVVWQKIMVWDSNHRHQPMVHIRASLPSVELVIKHWLIHHCQGRSLWLQGTVLTNRRHVDENRKQHLPGSWAGAKVLTCSTLPKAGSANFLSRARESIFSALQAVWSLLLLFSSASQHKNNRRQYVNTGFGCVPAEFYLWTQKLECHTIFTWHRILFFWYFYHL